MQPATRHTDPALRLTASTLATSGRLEATRLRLRLAIAALAGVAVTVLVMSAYQRSTASWVEHTRIVYQTTRSALLEIAASQRQVASEAAAGRPTNVPSAAIHDALIAHLDSVVALTVDNPPQQTRAREVRARADAWTRALTTASASSAAVPLPELRALALSVDSSATAFLAEEARLYNARLARFRRAEVATVGVVLAELVFVAVVLAAYARVVDRQIRTEAEQRYQLEEQAAELQAQAAELEVTNQELAESAKANEHALRAVEAESLERARAIALLDASLDSAPVAIAVLDRELRFVRVNRPWSLLDATAPADHVGRALADLPFAHDAVSAAVPFLERCLGDATVASNVELSGISLAEPGRRRYWLLSCAPVAVPGGDAIGVVVTLLDVTDRTRLSEEFLHIQKMEAVGRLAGGIAHDFNNSLAVINAYASMIEMSNELSAANRTRVEEIVGAVERAAVLTQQLLAFGRRQISQPRAVDVNDAVRRMTPMLIRVIPSPITLATRLDAVPATVVVDPAQLEQVLLNLVSNATHAMPDGGSLMIETDSIELDASYASAHAAVVPGSYVLLTVSDTGIGMDEQTLRRIFEPFFTTKEAGHGSGLGLASVYAIVRGADGYIWPYSEPGKGTTFKLYFPRASFATIPPAAPAVRTQPEEDTTILLVEDDAKLRPAVARLLEQAGYRVIQAAHGDAALNLLARHPATIDLVITDLVMPGMSGRELSERIATDFPGVPILFTSGYTDDIVIRQGMIQQGHPFVQKPFTREQLLAAIDGALSLS